MIDIDEKFAHPEHELFIFSVLLARFDMAKFFCFRSQVILIFLLISIVFFIFFIVISRLEFNMRVRGRHQDPEGLRVTVRGRG